MNKQKGSILRRRAPHLMVILLLLFLMSCSADQIEDPGTTTLFRTLQQPVDLSNSNGQETNVFHDFESVFANITDLVPTKQYCIEVSLAGSEAPFRRKIVTSDELGQILGLALLFDVGFDPVNNAPVLPGDYTVGIQGHNRDPFINFVVPFQVAAGPNPNTPSIIPTDNTGAFNGATVLAGGDLFARGFGFPPSTEVRIFVVEDRDIYNTGDLLTDISSGFETVTTNAAGELPNTLIWSGVSAVAGTALDLVGDTSPFGQFDATDALREARLSGVVVQNSSAATDIITDLAANPDGVFQDLFNQNDVITIIANPPQQPLSPSTEAAVYIVNHQDVWQAGDRLINVANLFNVSSHEMPNFECVRLLSGQKPIFPILNAPDLEFGRYDVIIDVGRNFVYDPGTDILDGGPNVGFILETADNVPEVRTFVSADEDFLTAGKQTIIYAKAVREDDDPIVGVPVSFRITDGPGVLSTTSTTTDDKGVATTSFSGGVAGKVTGVEVELIINGTTFSHSLSIWTKVRLHNQGGLGTGG